MAVRVFEGDENVRKGVGGEIWGTGQVKGGWTYRVVVSMQAEGKRAKGYGPNQH